MYSPTFICGIATFLFVCFYSFPTILKGGWTINVRDSAGVSLHPQSLPQWEGMWLMFLYNAINAHSRTDATDTVDSCRGSENAVDGGTVGCTCKVEKCDSKDA